MTLQVRRVITGHDVNGRAVVQIDDVSTNTFSARPGATAWNVWTTEGFPVDNTGDADAGGGGPWERHAARRLVARWGRRGGSYFDEASATRYSSEIDSEG